MNNIKELTDSIINYMQKNGYYRKGNYSNTIIVEIFPNPENSDDTNRFVIKNYKGCIIQPLECIEGLIEIYNLLDKYNQLDFYNTVRDILKNEEDTKELADELVKKEQYLNSIAVNCSTTDSVIPMPTDNELVKLDIPKSNVEFKPGALSAFMFNKPIKKEVKNGKEIYSV